jgi:hypothetical protein
MSERYCPKCAVEVEDLGGFCALGHSLKVAPITALTDLGDLKAEVNRAFAEAELQVASVLASVTGEIEAVRPQPVHAQGPPPPPPPVVEAPLVAMDAALEAEFEFDEEARARSNSFWKALESDPEPSRTDPITAFAPSPRMDWGPNKAPKRRRKP